MKKQKLIIMPLLLGATLCSTLLTSCADDGLTKIGILQWATHEALDAATEGFITALKEGGFEDGVNINIEINNPEGNASTNPTMANKLSLTSDLLYGVATSPAKALKNACKNNYLDTPVIFGAVTDPIGENLVVSMDDPKDNGNVTGVSDLGPVDKSLDVLNNYYEGVDKVAFLYNTGESNSVYMINLAKKYCEDNDWTFVDKGITNASQISTTMNSICSDESIDAIYIPTDNLIASSMNSVANAIDANSHKPTIACSDISTLEKGGIYGFGTDYLLAGKQAGEMAVKILNGEKPNEIAPEFMKDFPLVVNQTRATEIGVEIPSSLLEAADKII